MPHTTTCLRCGRAYAESSEERANVAAWAATDADRLCPACWRATRQAARVLAELDTTRQADAVLAELAADRYPTAAELNADTLATERAAREVLRDLATEASA